MPYDDCTGRVAGILETLNESYLRLLHPVPVRWCFTAGKNNGFASRPLLFTPSKQTNPRWGGANCAAGTEANKVHSPLRKTVHAKRLVMGIAITSDA